MTDPSPRLANFNNVVTPTEFIPSLLQDYLNVRGHVTANGVPGAQMILIQLSPANASAMGISAGANFKPAKSETHAHSYLSWSVSVSLKLTSSQV